jgi:hypothetical protein
VAAPYFSLSRYHHRLPLPHPFSTDIFRECFSGLLRARPRRIVRAAFFKDDTPQAIDASGRCHSEHHSSFHSCAARSSHVREAQR